MTERRARALLAGCLLAFAALACSIPGRDVWTIDPDAAAYVGLARSIAVGDGYTLDGVPHAKFPPGFPLLLSLGIGADGALDFARLQDLVTLAGWIGLLLVYPIGRRLLGLSPGAALLLAFAAITSRFWLNYSASFLRSEPLFFALMNGALLAAHGWIGKGGLGRAAWTGLLAGLAMITRTAGVVLLPAMVIARAFTTRPLRLSFSRAILGECAIVLVVGFAPTVLYQTTVRAESDGARSTGYMDELLAPYALDLTKDVDEGIETIAPFGAEMAQRIARNTKVLALSLGKFIANDAKGANIAVDPESESWDPQMRPPGWLLVGALLFGLLMALRLGQVLPALFVAAYVGLYLIWPFNQQERFYMPALPLLLYMMALTAVGLIDAMARLLGSPPGRVGAILAGAAAVVVIARGESDHGALLGRYSHEYAAMLALLGGALIALIVFTVLRRGQTLQAEQIIRPLRTAAIALFVLWNLISPARHWRTVHLKHREFLEERQQHPVPARFDSIRCHPELMAVFVKLMEHAAPDDIVMSDIPKMVYMATGLHAVPARVNTKEQRIILDLPDGRRPRFIYVSPEMPMIYDVFAKEIAAAPTRFKSIYEIPLREGTIELPLRVYEVLSDP